MSIEPGPTTVFTAEVEREDGWWIIHVLPLDVITQASRWSEVEDMARGVVIATLDLDEATEIALEIVPVFDDEAGRLLQAAEELEAQARELAGSASDTKRAAVQVLKSAGWTLQGIAAGVGLSYQRIEQLLKSSDTVTSPGATRVSASAQSRKTPPKEAAVPNRSAISGRYVSNAAAARHSRTTVREASGPNKAKSTVHRSAVTGRFVTKSTATRNPSGTPTERGRSKSK